MGAEGGDPLAVHADLCLNDPLARVGPSGGRVPPSGSSRFKSLTFPADDAVFAERVREALASAPAGEAATQEHLVMRLRAVHPKVSARFRDGMAEFGDRLLYVFRDGGAVPEAHDETWVEDPTTARVVTDASGTYLDANDAAAQLFGVERDKIVGAVAGSFTRPDVRVEDADALWHALDARGRLHSLAILRCPDGAERSVEFVTVRDGAGPGRHVTYLRAIG